MEKSVPNSVEIVDNHINQFFEADEDILVFDEIESEIIHRDIFFIKANEQRQYHILLSCGMSALPMKVPDDVESSPYAEVTILLPKEWNLNYDSFDDERNYWPIRLMKELMILPHPDETWLGFGHTFGHEEDEEFAEGIGFNAVMLGYSMKLSNEFTQIDLEDEQTITVYSLIPLYREELEFKKVNGASALLERFDQHKVGEIVKIGRPNVCV
jgi:hypothetical protein